VKVDGSIGIELPQQSTLQRNDEHRLKGSLGTNLFDEEKETSARKEINISNRGSLGNFIG
jgi:hypothetical protein